MKDKRLFLKLVNNIEVFHVILVPILGSNLKNPDFKLFLFSTHPTLPAYGSDHKSFFNCHSLVLILILISIKTRIDNIFGQKPPPHHPTTPPGTQLCLILLKLSTFQVNHQNKSCLSMLEQSKFCQAESLLIFQQSSKHTIVKKA